jgi:hypothetical protein
MKRPIVEALVASALVTAIVGIGAGFQVVPKAHVATFVGLVFLGATWLLVWRKTDDEVERHGIGFGGLLLAGEVDARAVAKSTAKALGWALVFAALIAVPFYFGWKWWWKPKLAFSLQLHAPEMGSEILGQLLLIALPEEAFYRGYLQTRLDDAIPPKWKVLGATIGPGLFIGAAIFAIGHVVTIRAPARLGVFFPALLFGWLRARTGGIGAGVAFHAYCNIYSELLGRGYGEY